MDNQSSGANEESVYWRELNRQAEMRKQRQTVFPAGLRVNDTLWNEAFAEFRRLKASGLTEAEAASVFTIFLNDPERKDAAEMLIARYGGK